jgi:hypothetical protein
MKEIMPNVDTEDKNLMEKLLKAGHIAHKYARRLQIISGGMFNHQHDTKTL